ncbi:T-complex protein 11-like protein 1 [Agrilus planipennis]|uniref:T-complex protein 11-like protein 1 n=1 Tax=Agrilus planipennis TaxID=224129 RepID=A0A1W4XJT6_AGRPL|nr:T-complex protein 11-like protein 1 [Agrilus planipennis]
MYVWSIPPCEDVDHNGQENGASSRTRTQSECSAASDDGNNAGKRQRTTSQQLLASSGITAASPPKFVSLEEIMKAANGMRDMSLVHQIAVDNDFRLQQVDPPTNTLHKAVKESMHKAFWDILKIELNENPPSYTQALRLLEDIKEGLFRVLLPQHSKLKQQISEVLDNDLIRQQAEKGTLDFRHYAQYVISVMSRLCAPVRDEKIKQLTEMTDVIDTFKGILETLDLMALDMANFTIDMVRPDIIAHSVELERKKFADYLAVQPDGLQHTRNWLLRHVSTIEAVPSNVDRNSYIKHLTKKTFSEACLDLLEWNAQNPYPETFMLDEERLSNIELQTNRLIIAGSILLITGSYVGPDLQFIMSFKETIKEHSLILLQTVTSEKDLKNTLPNIAIQIIKDVKQAQEKHGLPQITKEVEELLTNQIVDLTNPEHRIRQLVRQRIREFLLQIIQSSTAAPQKVPSGLTTLQKELTTVAGQFLKIISHNSSVFCNYYYDILDNAIPKN